MKKYRYREIAKLPKEFSTKIVSSTPTVTDGDYKRGYITRYFTQKSNDISSTIYEIDKKQYSSLQQNPFYSVVDLLWAISGNEEEVKEKNKKSLIYSSNIMRSLPKYVGNLTQFYKK